MCTEYITGSGQDTVPLVFLDANYIASKECSDDPRLVTLLLQWA